MTAALQGSGLPNHWASTPSSGRSRVNAAFGVGTRPTDVRYRPRAGRNDRPSLRSQIPSSDNLKCKDEDLVLITDVHVHHVPEAFVRMIERAAPLAVRLDPPDGESVKLKAGPLCYTLNRTFFDVERLIARMATMKVERAVLSLATPFVNYGVPASLGCEVAKFYNDEIAKVCRLAPDRFGAWAYLPMQDAHGAAAELRRAIRELRLTGAYLPSNVNGRYLDAEEFAPIFSTAAELDIPLFVHPSNPPARERTAHYELAVVAGYLFDTTLNIFHMIFGGLFDRYPHLRICFTHLGGYVTLLYSRMTRELDTNPHLAAKLRRPLLDYLRSLYFDTICFDPIYARSAVDSRVVDFGHLLLGSDTPFLLGEPDPVGFVERSFHDHGTTAVKTILECNAVEFLASGKRAG
jgi:aminocarboxymuconate-semialdehyde decarboxylase